jgi:hypothetical protein
MAFPQPSIVNRSATRPIYIIVVEDPSDPDGIVLYKSQDVTECNFFLEFRGIQLTKAQAAKTTKDPHATIETKTEIKPINRRIPWSRVIRMDHITYNKTPQGEIK